MATLELVDDAVPAGLHVEELAAGLGVASTVPGSVAVEPSRVSWPWKLAEAADVRAPGVGGVERAAGRRDPARRRLAGSNRGDRCHGAVPVRARTWPGRWCRLGDHEVAAPGRSRSRTGRCAARSSPPGADGAGRAADVEHVDVVAVGLRGHDQLRAVGRERDLPGRVRELRGGGRVQAERAGSLPGMRDEATERTKKPCTTRRSARSARTRGSRAPRCSPGTCRPS